MKNAIKMLAVMLAVSVSFTSEAADKYVYFGAWSKHFVAHPQNVEEDATKHKYEFNENHKLVAFQYGSYMIGRFENSFYQETYIATKQWDLVERGNVKIIGALGLTHGYHGCSQKNDEDDAETCPYGSIGIAYTKYRIQPMLSLGARGNVFQFTLRYQL